MNEEYEDFLRRMRREADDDRERCLTVGAALADLPLERAIRILRRSLEAAEAVATQRAA